MYVFVCVLGSGRMCSHAHVRARACAALCYSQDIHIMCLTCDRQRSQIVCPHCTFTPRSTLATPSPFAGGYFAWAVVGYGLGLAVTLAANVYGWTFYGVRGQPALLYLVPGVVGALLCRSVLNHYVAELWAGSALPQPPPDTGTVICDGCQVAAL